MQSHMVIEPIIRRHAQDAAWYYTQFEADRASALVTWERHQHYQRIFVAHLDGLLTAGAEGQRIAREQLQRWQGHGELFVHWYLTIAHAQNKTSGAGELLKELRQLSAARSAQPYRDAAAAALSWLPAENVHPLLEDWLTSGQTLQQHIALNAYGLRREMPLEDIAPLFLHAAPAVRAEACRFAGRTRCFSLHSRLKNACGDPDRNVREEAAVALLLCNDPLSALPELYAAVRHHEATAAAEAGSIAILAEGRAQYLARLFGHALPFPCPDAAMDQLLKELPLYLSLLMLAHHGDPSHIDRLFSHMKNTPYARRILWVICFLTDLNPDLADVTALEAPMSADWPYAPGLDQDTGLPEPAPHKVALWWETQREQYIRPCTPFLVGQPLSDMQSCAEILSDSRRTQAQRFAAALNAARLDAAMPWLDTRAPVVLQHRLATHALRSV